MTPARRKRIIERYGGKCATCESTGPFHIDHIQALARGGSDDDSNLRPLCVDCHRRKTFGRKHRRLGSDQFEIAKTKRLVRKKRKSRK